MNNKKKSTMIRFITLIIVIALMAPVEASAAVRETMQPYASAYLDNYGAYVYLAGDGLVQVYFNVEGTNYMDELGVLTIKLYESPDKETWTRVETFKHDTTPGMLSYNDDFHSGHVDYQGEDGLYYKAYVCVWGGKDGDGDTRYFWTSVKP